MQRSALTARALLQGLSGSRTLSTDARTAVLFPGDGIGPEIAEAVKLVFAAAQVPLTWTEEHVGTTVDPRTNSMVSRENLDAVLVQP